MKPLSMINFIHSGRQIKLDNEKKKSIRRTVQHKKNHARDWKCLKQTAKTGLY